MVEHEEPKKHRHVGTIEGAAFIIGILLLVVVFYHIIPELQRFGDYITEDTQKLQEDISILKSEQEKLAKQICTSNFDREVSELRSVVLVLNDLEKKGSKVVKDQAVSTYKEIETLINLLQTEAPTKE